MTVDETWVAARAAWVAARTEVARTESAWLQAKTVQQKAAALAALKRAEIATWAAGLEARAAWAVAGTAATSSQEGHYVS